MSERVAGREGARRHTGNEGQAMKKMRIMVLALMALVRARWAALPAQAGGMGVFLEAKNREAALVLWG